MRKISCKILTNPAKNGVTDNRTVRKITLVLLGILTKDVKLWLRVNSLNRCSLNDKSLKDTPHLNCLSISQAFFYVFFLLKLILFFLYNISLEKVESRLFQLYILLNLFFPFFVVAFKWIITKFQINKHKKIVYFFCWYWTDYLWFFIWNLLMWFV